MQSIFTRKSGRAGDAVIAQDVADPKIAPLRGSERISDGVEAHHAEEGDGAHAVDLLEGESKQAVADPERGAKVHCSQRC